MFDIAPQDIAYRIVQLYEVKTCFRAARCEIIVQVVLFPENPFTTFWEHGDEASHFAGSFQAVTKARLHERI